MPQYIRVKITGGTYFLTIVTFQRRHIFKDKDNIHCFMNTLNQVQIQYPFVVEALVVLPDHLHVLCTLPKGDGDFSKRWGLIKANFSKKVKADWHREDLINSSRMKRQETTIWQRRFWEHAIRDEEDFKKHFDYIHYNPVKHGLVSRVQDWPYSSFHRHVKQGVYPTNWGAGVSFLPEDAFGE